MTTVLFEELESEIIDDKLKQGKEGLKFLLEISQPMTIQEKLALSNIIIFCVNEYDFDKVLRFCIEALTDEYKTFESKYDVALDDVRKLVLKNFSSHVIDKKPQYITVDEAAEYLTHEIKSYKNCE